MTTPEAEAVARVRAAPQVYIGWGGDNRMVSATDLSTLLALIEKQHEALAVFAIHGVQFVPETPPTIMLSVTVAAGDLGRAAQVHALLAEGE